MRVWAYNPEWFLSLNSNLKSKLAGTHPWWHIQTLKNHKQIMFLNPSPGSPGLIFTPLRAPSLFTHEFLNAMMHHSFVQPFIRSFVRSFTHSLMRWPLAEQRPPHSASGHLMNERTNERMNEWPLGPWKLFKSTPGVLGFGRLPPGPQGYQKITPARLIHTWNFEGNDGSLPSKIHV